MGAKCPHCGGEFADMPKRKTTCPSCHQSVFVRQHPFTEEQTLVTEREANAIDWLKGGVRGGVLAKKDYEAMRTLLAKGLEREPTESEIVRGLQVEETLKQLEKYQREKLRQVEILAGTCDKCKPLASKIFTVSQALKEMPIPLQSCERGVCRCVYLPVEE